MLALKLKPGADPERLVQEISRDGLRPPMRAFTWETGNSEFLQVIIMEKMMMSIIIMLIILVASFSICSSLYTSVLRKTKEIGLQGAMGARGWEIAASYCLQGFMIGLLGSLVGLCFTFLLLHFRDPIVTFVVGQENLSQFYFFTRLPVMYDFFDGLKACMFAIVLCTLAGFLPALRASRMKSSEAMRNE
jgi:lipoprotein-releasing system permease protein